MAIPVPVPRVNTNDDDVQLVQLNVRLGEHVSEGQLLAAVETDKAVVEVASPGAGYIVHLAGEVGARVRVGGILAWLGATPEEKPPVASPGSEGPTPAARPTAKALSLLRAHGLDAADVARSGDRLSAEDVLRHVRLRQSANAQRSRTGDEPSDPA